jgi:hypothetical protein
MDCIAWSDGSQLDDVEITLQPDEVHIGKFDGAREY